MFTNCVTPISLNAKILLHDVTVPLNVHIALPLLAFILVKLAKQLQVAPLFKVRVDVNVPSSDVNKIVAPFLVRKQFKAVVIV